MNNYKKIFIITIGIVVAIFLILQISTVIQNNSKSNYKVLIVSNESTNSEKYEWVIKHPKVWSSRYGTLRELEEKYGKPMVMPTYLVTKVNRKILFRGYYTEVIYITHDIEELRMFLNK